MIQMDPLFMNGGFVPFAPYEQPNSGMRLQPIADPNVQRPRNPIGDLVRNKNPIGGLLNPQQPQMPQAPTMGFGLLDDIGSGPSAGGTGDFGMSAPTGAQSAGGFLGLGEGVEPVSFGRGGGGFSPMSIGNAARSDSGRGILGAISTAGLAFPNPVSTAAGIINAGTGIANMVDLNGTRGSYGMAPLSFGQMAGGLLGTNDYASQGRGFNASMAQAISNGQNVMAPQVFGQPNGMNMDTAPNTAFAPQSWGDLAALAAYSPEMAYTPENVVIANNAPASSAGQAAPNSGWYSGSGVPGDFAFSDPSMGGYDFGFSGGPGY